MGADFIWAKISQINIEGITDAAKYHLYIVESYQFNILVLKIYE